MAQDDLVLYLTLSPEFGGTRFGPFEGLEARLGADRDRCHITLPEALGVAKEHCKVIRQGGASMILSPSDRTAAVFLWKGDARRPMQVQTPTAVRPGDSFALVTPDGPRFFIELGELPPEAKAKRQASKRGPQNLTAGKFASAGKDLFLARLYTLSPVSLAMRGMHMVKSGAIWQPRIIILGAIMLFGYMSAGMGSCAAFKFKRDVSSKQVELDSCNESLSYAKNMGGDVENFQFHQLAASILGMQSLGQALQKDTQLQDKVKAQAKKIAMEPEPYRWLLDKSARAEEFAQWRERMDKAEALDPATRKLAAYLAAHPRRVKGNWGKIFDAQQAEVCGRGPIRLTYRQGRNLGLTSVALDAYVFGDTTSLTSDEGERSKLLVKTAEAAGEAAPEGTLASAVEVITQGEMACIRGEGDDDREANGKLSSMLAGQIGKNARYVPDAEAAFGPVARVAKLFAADVRGQRYGAESASADLSKGMLSSALGEVQGGDWVMDRTAEVIARALVLPCDGVLEDKAKAEAVYGTLPNPIMCLVLNYRLTHDG